MGLLVPFLLSRPYLRRRGAGEEVKQKIVAFEQGEDGDWLAVLACGHRQHVRHNPPLVSRPWVQTETGRNQFLGYELNCKRCDDEKAQ